MTVTSDLVEAYLKCPTKCFLLSHEEVGTGNAYAEWTRTKSASFRSEGIQRFVATLAPEKCATSMPGLESLRAINWQLATDFKACSNNLQVSCHAVEHILPPERGGVEQFAPIRFVLRNKLTRHDKLVVAFDGLALSEVLGLKVEIGKIVHGNKYAVFKVKIPTLASDVRTLTENVSKLVSSPSPPPLVLNRHCPECEFQARCRQKAIEQDDLNLLKGIRNGPSPQRKKAMAVLSLERGIKCSLVRSFLHLSRKSARSYWERYRYPVVKTAPLPAGAQFLNVIESVFSGMARAIIHNSDYCSVEAAKDAIDRYYAERNEYFRAHPKRAGHKIWGQERTQSEFHESNNCKDPLYCW